MKQPPKQLPVQHRTVTLDVDTRASENGSLRVSLSSEQPVPRFFGTEILSHAKSAIDLSYAARGLPLLKDHNTREQIGIIENVRVERGRLVGDARPGKHPDAGYVFDDMRSGVRPNMSVGYIVRSMALVRSDKDGDTYEVDKWTPVEGSTVPVPADPTVGVGRNGDERLYPVAIRSQPGRGLASTRRNTMSEQDNGVTVTRDLDAETESYRVTMSNLAKAANMPPTVTADAIKRHLTPEQFSKELQELAIARAASAPSVGVRLTDRENKNYSLLRFLHAQMLVKLGNPNAFDAVKAGFEREVSQEQSKITGREGFFVPLSLATRASVTGGVAGTTSLGGAGVQTTILDLIELLRNQSVVRQLGARVLTGLSSNITFPRQITANSVTWTGENPSTGNANTAMTFDTVALTPKTAMVSTAMSRQLIVQMSEDAESLAREDLARVLAVELDRVAINGTGSSNQPRGVLQSTATSTVTTTFGSNGAVPNWAAIVDFETTLANSNAPTGSTPWRWLTTPGVRGKLKQTLANTVSGASWIWDSDNKMNSYQAFVSNNVPTNFTAGTSTTICHGMVLGQWAELLIGEWGGGIETIVDPYTVASQNMVQFHSIMMVDVALRHGASFAITKAALTA